jgi:hypothetical protein
MPFNHSSNHDYPTSRSPTIPEVKSLDFIPLIYCLVKNQTYRQRFVDEVEARLSRDFTLERLQDELSKGKISKPASSEVRPSKNGARVKDTPLLNTINPLSPESLLFKADGTFNPLTRSWDEEFPAHAICEAILSTPWKGEDLGAYSARETMDMVREMKDREIVSNFDSDKQERMLKSIVGNFNSWARKNLSLRG